MASRQIQVRNEGRIIPKTIFCCVTTRKFPNGAIKEAHPYILPQPNLVSPFFKVVKSKGILPKNGVKDLY